MTIEEKCINTIRCLAIDAVQKAGSNFNGPKDPTLEFQGAKSMRCERRLKAPVDALLVGTRPHPDG